MRSQAYNIYRILTAVLAPVMPLWLRYRMSHGKEDAHRIRERFGYASRMRPGGKLVWFHAASVGESASLLPLLAQMRERFAALPILVTTGTLTSAQMMKTRLPKGVIHQYAPIDTPQAARRFMDYWRPNFSFWVESEFWPNLIYEANESQSFMGVVGARMSEHSFESWRKYPGFARRMLGCFDIVFAQTDTDGARLHRLGAQNIIAAGNLKYDAPMLPCNESELLALQTQLAGRPVWLAASTHPGEEAIIAKTHELLCAARPDLLTIIVPRHPQRGGEIAVLLAKTGEVAQRSKQEHAKDAAFYVADTLGELGLFYRLSEIVFIGGSLVAHGGQNPLEPARLSCAVIAGPHTHNFADIYAEMQKLGGMLRAQDAESLAQAVTTLMNNSDARRAQQKAAKLWVESKSGASSTILATLAPLFARAEEKS